MAQFIDPFVVKQLERKLDNRELARAIRQSLSAEEEATHLYEAYADVCEDKKFVKVFQDIANEEKVHVGEFQKLLEILEPEEEKLIDKGKKEIEELISEAKCNFSRRSYQNYTIAPKVPQYNLNKWKYAKEKMDLLRRTYPDIAENDAIKRFTKDWNEREKFYFEKWLRLKCNQGETMEKQAYNKIEDRSFGDWKRLLKKTIQNAWKALNNLTNMPLLDSSMAEQAKQTLHQFDVETDKLKLEAMAKDRLIRTASILKKCGADESAQELEKFLVVKAQDEISIRLGKAIDNLESVIAELTTYPTVPDKLNEVVSIVRQYTDIPTTDLTNASINITRMQNASLDAIRSVRASLSSALNRRQTEVTTKEETIKRPEEREE